MANKVPISPFIRFTCGFLGVLGFSAIGFDVVQDGHLKFSLILFAKFFAGFIFLYVAIFGSNPFDFSPPRDSDT